MKKCCGKTSGLLKIAILIFLVTLILYLIGFASPFWSRRTGSNEGLFEVCQAGTCIPSAQSTVLSTESWYVAAQATSILSLFMVITALVLLMVLLFAAKLANSIPILISALAFTCFAILFILIALVVYGVRGSVFIEGMFGTPFEVGFAYILMAVSLFGFLAVSVFLIIDLDRNLKTKDSDEETGEAGDTKSVHEEPDADAPSDVAADKESSPSSADPVTASEPNPTSPNSPNATN